jgi:hypothetical protein
VPLRKLLFRPGVNRENTRYAAESIGGGGSVQIANSTAGWYDCDKIRFRSGTPEKIGGWQRISTSTFEGICRSLWNWVTLGSLNLIGVGTNLKFYIENGGLYYDITPIRSTVTLTNPFKTTSGSPIVEVTDANGGYIDGDFVTFTGGTAVGGLTIVGEYELVTNGGNTYTIDVGTPAASTATGGGTVYATYQINVGPAYVVPLVGWGAGPWGSGAWGFGQPSTDSVRLWSQSNFGEDLIYGPRGGGIYYWDATIGLNSPSFTVTIASPGVVSTSISLVNGTPVQLETTGALPTGLIVGTTYYVVNSSGTTFQLSATYGGAAINTSGTQSGIHSISSRGINLASFGGASGVPVIQNGILVSDISRFVFALGCNDYGSTVLDPMLVRWSDQEDATNWTPAATNQAGSLRLSKGSEIITGIQARQEVLVWTDSSLYSFQYAGAPSVWGAQLVGDNISIASQNAVAYAGGVAYWMGKDKFYKYDGRTQTLRCDLRQYVFSDIDQGQYEQVFAGTNEGFNEIWWWYCSSGSTTIDKYVVYNYLEDVWYYGTMARTAWLDSGLRDYPIAAGYANNIMDHEFGVDNNETGTTLPIAAFITSAEFDLDDGHQFMFVWRMLPDITFRGSSANSPSATMYLLPLKNSGSGYTDPPSVGGSNNATITRTAVIPIEQFTGQVFTRVRARQMAMKVESTGVGVTWQLGAPRIDTRPDGRR